MLRRLVIFLTMALPVQAQVVWTPEELQALEAQLEAWQQHPLNLNTASASELAALPWLTPYQRRELLAFRKQHGPLTSLEELLRIPGFTSETLDLLRPYVTVRPPPPRPHGQFGLRYQKGRLQPQLHLVWHSLEVGGGLRDRPRGYVQWRHRQTRMILGTYRLRTGLGEILFQGWRPPYLRFALPDAALRPHGSGSAYDHLTGAALRHGPFLGFLDIRRNIWGQALGLRLGRGYLLVQHLAAGRTHQLGLAAQWPLKYGRLQGSWHHGGWLLGLQSPGGGGPLWSIAYRYRSRPPLLTGDRATGHIVQSYLEFPMATAWSLRLQMEGRWPSAPFTSLRLYLLFSTRRLALHLGYQERWKERAVLTPDGLRRPEEEGLRRLHLRGRITPWSTLEGRLDVQYGWGRGALLLLQQTMRWEPLPWIHLMLQGSLATGTSPAPLIYAYTPGLLGTFTPGIFSRPARKGHLVLRLRRGTRGMLEGHLGCGKTCRLEGQLRWRF